MSTKNDHDCRHVDGRRLVNRVHLRDCNASGCEGCQPCVPEHGHCHRCGHVHLDAQHPRTCPACVGKVRQDILEIVDQTAEAHNQLVHRSIHSIVFMVNGPAANYEAHSYIHHSATSGRLCKCARRGMTCPTTLDPILGPVCKACQHPSCRAIRRPLVCPDTEFILEGARGDDLHPLTVLAGWDLTWRRALNHDTRTVTPHGSPIDADVTIYSASGYLLNNLTYMAQQPDDVADFNQFARDIAACRSWLTDVLRLGIRPDRGGTCPMCGKADLVKAYDDEDEGTPYVEGREEKAYDDLWVCPRPECAQTWTDDEYRSKVQGIYVGVADRLTASQLRDRFRVPESTIRRWASGTSPTVRTHGRDKSGRQLYNVADVEAMREKTTGAAS